MAVAGAIVVSMAISSEKKPLFIEKKKTSHLLKKNV